LDVIVEAIPNTLDAVYDKVLSASRDPEYVTKLLHIAVAAIRSLSLKEMSVVLLDDALKASPI
jgi:hypothetical protein